MSRTGGHFDFLACGVRVFLERDERTRGLEKTKSWIFSSLSIFKTQKCLFKFWREKNFATQGAGDKETHEKHDEDNNEETKRRRRCC